MRRVNRLEWMAVGWGGTVAGLGIILVSTGDGLWRVVVMGVLCLIAGFLAGVRAEDRRVLHAMVTGPVGALFWVAFVVLTRVADPLGGPAGASWRIGGAEQVRNLVIAAAVVIAGGALAAYRLRPQGHERRVRSDRRR